MVRLAGGVDDLAREGAYSEQRVVWDDVLAWAPEVLIVMPCGFDLRNTVTRAQEIFALPGYSDIPAVQAGRVFAVDANAYFARPGPRVIDGTELLAHLIHPDRFGWSGPADAFAKLAPNPDDLIASLMHKNAGVVHAGGRPKACWRCGAQFECGPRDGAAQCWCGNLPPIQPTAEGSDCLCPGCLTIAASLQKRDQIDPVPPHRSAPVEGIDYYLEGTAVVFTASYHLRRGSCCGNGCRHCPYHG